MEAPGAGEEIKSLKPPNSGWFVARGGGCREGRASSRRLGEGREFGDKNRGGKREFGDKKNQGGKREI